MMASEQHITDIAKQARHHSFLLLQTKHKQLAEKWQYYILSSNGQLLPTNEQTKNGQEYEYNVTVDAVGYEVGGRMVLLAAVGDLLASGLGDLAGREFVAVGGLGPLRFYLYAGEEGQPGDEFVELQPEYLLKGNCLVFEIRDTAPRRQQLGRLTLSTTPQATAQTMRPIPSQYWSTLKFKDISNAHRRQMLLPPKIVNVQDMYCFRSEYALLSDQHFLNCLVRGYKPTGCYVKRGQYYVFKIDADIYSILQRLYLMAKL